MNEHLPKRHDLKTWHAPFQAVWDGLKTAELRKNDRLYRVGDALNLREYDPESGRYSGRRIYIPGITHIIEDSRFGLMPGFALLSFAPNILRAEAGEDSR